MSLEDRIRRLESDSKFWRLIAISLGIVIVVGTACTTGDNGAESRASAQSRTASEASSVIRASRFELIDDSGKAVGSFEARFGKVAILSMEAEHGSISLSASGLTCKSSLGQSFLSGSQLKMNGEFTQIDLTDNSSAKLAISSEGIDLYLLDDEYRRVHRALKDAQEADPESGLSDGEKQLRMNRVVELMKEESNSSRKLPLIEIGRTNSGGGILDVYSPLGKKVVTVQAGKNNSGLVSVKDFNGENGRSLVAD